LGYTLEGVDQEIVQLKKRLVFMVSIALLLGGCSSIILALLVKPPIAALVEQTKITGAGNYENKVVNHSKDILGQLANEFNKMGLAVKTKQQELVDSEKRLRRVVENMPAMMEAIDEDYKIIAWNRECERVTGYSAKEMIGNPNYLEIIHPDADYRKKMQAELADLGSDFRNKEFSLTCKDSKKNHQ
jgi:PAS domain S-box-containing protein